MSLRYDTATLGKPQKDPKTGWLRVDAYVSRTGVQPYIKGDGRVFREYRPDEEVFHKDSLKSFELVPFTNDHPVQNGKQVELNADNTKDFQVGTVFAPRRGENGHLAATILITDSVTIADVEAGRTQVSVGYYSDVVETPGEVDGERFDGVQKNIRANHVALVTHARAGASTSIKLDNADSAALISEADSRSSLSAPEEKKMAIEVVNTVKLKFDSAELDVSEEVAKALASERAAKDTAFKAESAKVQKEAARADSAEAQVKTLKAELVEAPKKAKVEAEARAALEATAKGILGDEAKFDGLSDLDVQKLVAEKVHGIRLEGKPEHYVQASYDIALTKAADKGEPRTERVQRSDDAGKTRGQLAIEILNKRSQIK